MIADVEKETQSRMQQAVDHAREDLSTIRTGRAHPAMYILTQMTEYGLDYDDVLKIAQEKGFAEADPTADVEGIDVANKLSILMALAFEKYVAPGDIPTEGITKITKKTLDLAKANGCKVKLVASAKKVGDKENRCQLSRIREQGPRPAASPPPRWFPPGLISTNRMSLLHKQFKHSR